MRLETIQQHFITQIQA